jgi:hypothetical protein
MEHLAQIGRKCTSKNILRLCLQVIDAIISKNIKGKCVLAK